MDFDPTLKTIDKPGAFEKIRSAFVADMRPVGALEESLVERLALLTLRQQRVARFEHGILSERVQATHDRGWENIQSYRASKNKYRDAFNWLQGHPDGEEIPLPFATSILRTAASHAEFDLAKSPIGFSAKDGSMIFLKAKNASAKDLEDEESPAYACIEWNGARYDLYTDWTAGKLKAALSMVAQAANTTLEEITAGVSSSFRERIAVEYARTEAQKNRESIPGDPLGVLKSSDLDRITEYEGHLREEFAATFKQLQAAQGKRLAPAVGGNTQPVTKRSPHFTVLKPREEVRRGVGG